MSGHVERVEVPPPNLDRRRAVVRLSAAHLAALIELPAGLSVQAIRTGFERDTIDLMVEGETLFPVADGAYPPELEGGAWSRLSFVDDAGRRWARFEWTPEPEPAAEDVSDVVETMRAKLERADAEITRLREVLGRVATAGSTHGLGVVPAVRDWAREALE